MNYCTNCSNTYNNCSDKCNENKKVFNERVESYNNKCHELKVKIEVKLINIKLYLSDKYSDMSFDELNNNNNNFCDMEMFINKLKKYTYNYENITINSWLNLSNQESNYKEINKKFHLLYDHIFSN
jgi:hypothetical protein